jgi:hypothetical protein
MVSGNKGGTLNYLLPDKLFEICILRVISAGFVLSLVHCAIHAGFEKGAVRLIGSRCNKFVEFIDVSLKISPHKINFAVCFPGVEFKFFGDEKHPFFIRYDKNSDRLRGKWHHTYFHLHLLAVLDHHPHTL